MNDTRSNAEPNVLEGRDVPAQETEALMNHIRPAIRIVIERLIAPAAQTPERTEQGLDHDRMLPSTEELPLAQRETEAQVSTARLTRDQLLEEMICNFWTLVKMLAEKGVLGGEEQAAMKELCMRSERLRRNTLANLEAEERVEQVWEKHRARVRRRRVSSSRL